MMCWFALGEGGYRKKKKLCVCVPDSSSHAHHGIARLSILAQPASSKLSQDGCSNQPWTSWRLDRQAQQCLSLTQGATRWEAGNRWALISLSDLAKRPPKPPCFFVLHPGPAQTSRKLDSILQPGKAGRATDDVPFPSPAAAYPRCCRRCCCAADVLAQRPPKTGTRRFGLGWVCCRLGRAGWMGLSLARKNRDPFPRLRRLTHTHPPRMAWHSALPTRDGEDFT